MINMSQQQVSLVKHFYTFSKPEEVKVSGVSKEKGKKTEESL